MAFNEETLANVANLARLNLSEAARQKFAGEVNGILNWVEQLQQVNVDGIEPLISVTAQTNAERKDEVTDGNIQADLMKNAPESAHGFFVVPKMVE
ncbi:MAG: Asp-tRNA(Asn)/Glu-tRNA(Gln) amidotransferase subunit GatC [Alphaproteobacteria bacterium]